MQEQFILEETVGEQPRRAAVVVGRFQPPTIGHYAVIDAAKKFIRDNPEMKLDAVPVLVVVDGKETSKDHARNPLTADERIAFMTGSGRADGVKILKAASAFEAFEAVRRAGFEPVAVAAGNDRAKTYLGMLDKYFKTKDGSKIKHHKIQVNRDDDAGALGFGDIDKEAGLESILQYTDDKIPTSMVSASLARHAVQRDALDKFQIITGLPAKLAKMMFAKIKSATAAKDDNGFV